MKYTYWDFLDKFNGNLLYGCAGNKKYQFNNQNEVYYYIWFLFRYVLKCETLEDALTYATAKTMKELDLARCFIKCNDDNASIIVLGNEAFGTVKLYTRNVSNNGAKNPVSFLRVVLEILYKRYNFLEQLDCYIKYAVNNKPVSKYEYKQPAVVKEVKEILRNAIDYMEQHREYRELLDTYYESRERILGNSYYEI